MHGEPACDGSTPLVSVCIPTFNAASVVKDALDSALRQEYTPLEILVIDNHSSDDTWRVVIDTSRGDDRVRCLRNEENIGMAGNFSACIAAARGEFILVLCADDILGPGCVGILASALRGHRAAVLAACGRIAVDQSLRPLKVLRSRTRTEKVDGETLARECFVHGNRIGEPSAVMFDRSRALRGFNPDYSQGLDLEMWFHLLGQGPAVLLHEPLCSIRQHAQQTTQANIASGRIVSDKRLLFRQYGKKMGSALRPWEKLLWDARMASSVGRTRAAGGKVVISEIVEVFYEALFGFFMVPLALFAWTFGGTVISRKILRKR